MENMTKKERVHALLAGQSVDRIPVGFWQHFPEESFYGQASVKAHLNYFEKTRTDLCKVMTEHLYPCDHSIFAARDWANIPVYDEKADFIVKQAELIRTIVKECPNESISATLHGVFASGSHTLLGYQRYDTLGRYAMYYHVRTDPEAMAEGYRRIAETMCAAARAYIQAGAEGLYYAALGGEWDGLTDEEHAELIAPLDRKIIEAAYDAGAKYVVLHMCKPHVSLKRFLDYPADIVNWGVEESGISLAEGAQLFSGKIILGGFNTRKGSLITGTYDEMKTELQRHIAEVPAGRYIVGADCTLPGSTPYEKPATVVQALESLSPLS